MEAITALLRTAVYIRVSSEEQVRFGDSVRDQRERCLEYIRNRPDLTLSILCVDDGVSGQKLDRDEFSRLLSDVKEEKLDLIIFTKLDRWFRSLRHYLNTQAILEQHHVAWLAIDQPYFDTSTPHGRAFVNQSMMWAELEAQNDSVRIRDVFASKIKYGEAVTGKVPIGYTIHEKHLVPNAEAPVIAQLFEFFQNTQSLSQTREFLKFRYGISMTLNNLRTSVLRNSKYTGRYGGNNTYCPPLVPDPLFDQVQVILNRRMNIKSSQKYPYLFPGLLFCGRCGGRIYGCQIHVVTRKKSGKEYRYQYPGYECRHSGSGCSFSGRFREARVEEYLFALIKEEMDSWEVVYDISDSKKTDPIPPARNRLLKKLNRLKELYVNGVIPLDEYKQDRQICQNQLDELSVNSALTANASIKEDAIRLSLFLQSGFEAVYTSFDNEEKRTFWRSVIREIKICKSTGGQLEFQVEFL